MNKEKFETAKEKLEKLLAIQQQHKDKTFNKTQADKAIYESLDGLIADAAADLLDAYKEGEDFKSEMPCDCAKCDSEEYDETERQVAKVFEDLITSLDKIIADKKNP